MSTLDCATAERCYQLGERAYGKGFYLDAQAMFDRAWRLEPENAIYRDARERLRVLAFRFGKGGVGGFGKETLNTCALDCGECCCEACGEGCCEFLCEGLCSNCDCS